MPQTLALHCAPVNYRVDNTTIAAVPYADGHDFATKRSSNTSVKTSISFVIGFETLAQECSKYVSSYLCRFCAALVMFGECPFPLAHYWRTAIQYDNDNFSHRVYLTSITRRCCGCTRVYPRQDTTRYVRRSVLLWLTGFPTFRIVEHVLLTQCGFRGNVRLGGLFKCESCVINQEHPHLPYHRSCAK